MTNAIPIATRVLITIGCATEIYINSQTLEILSHEELGDVVTSLENKENGRIVIRLNEGTDKDRETPIFLDIIMAA